MTASISSLPSAWVPIAARAGKRAWRQGGEWHAVVGEADGKCTVVTHPERKVVVALQARRATKHKMTLRPKRGAGPSPADAECSDPSSGGPGCLGQDSYRATHHDGPDGPEAA